MTDNWRQAQAGITELDELRRKALPQMDKINKIHAKLALPKFQDGAHILKNANAAKMIDYYTSAQQKSVIEIELTDKILADLDACIALTEAAQPRQVSPTEPVKYIQTVSNSSVAMTSNINSSAQTSNESTNSDHKHKISGEDQPIAVKKIKIDNAELLPPGARVAVRPSNTIWILAVVVRFLHDKQKYDVEDAEDDEKTPGVRKRYLFPARSIIAIDGGFVKKELQTGMECLVLYPDSTCFYPAFVVTPPSKLDGSPYKDHYAVRFEDDDGVVKYIDAQMVLEVPKVKATR